MTLFDLILILIVFGFGWFGFWFGLIHAVGGLIGLILGTAVASRYYDDLASKVLFIFNGNVNLANIVSFMVLYVIGNRLVGFVFYILDKILKPITNLPFLKTINRLAGGIFGLIEGILTIGLFIYFIGRFPLPWLANLIEQSKIAWYFVKIANLILPLLPEILKNLKSII
jgi:membrane protein required for colicin V production